MDLRRWKRGEAPRQHPPRLRVRRRLRTWYVCRRYDRAHDRLWRGDGARGLQALGRRDRRSAAQRRLRSDRVSRLRPRRLGGDPQLRCATEPDRPGARSHREVGQERFRDGGGTEGVAWWISGGARLEDGRTIRPVDEGEGKGVAVKTVFESGV